MATRKRNSKSSSRTAKQAAKTGSKAAEGLGLSPILSALLVLVVSVFLYCVYLENDTEDISPAAAPAFVSQEADLEIHFIDVGQGDCSLIIWNGSAMLIDSGEKEEAKTVLKYLKKQGVEKLDYIIVTHPHSDHMGSMSEIISAVDVGKVIAPRVSEKLTPTSKTYEDFLLALRNKALKLTAAKPETVYTLGTSEEDGKSPPEFEILAPLEDYDDLNNYSVVLRLTYGSTAYLFTGDAEKKAERDILESGAKLDADVMKLGHHGSSSSTSEKFLEAVSPDYCIIQCGAGNTYGHPHKDTIEAVEEAGAEWYSNDRDGTIVIYSDGKEIFIQKEKNN